MQNAKPTFPPHASPDALLLNDGGTQRPAQRRPLGNLMAWLAAGPQPQTDTPANHPPPRTTTTRKDQAEQRAAPRATPMVGEPPSQERPARNGETSEREDCQQETAKSAVSHRSSIAAGWPKRKADQRRLTEEG